MQLQGKDPSCLREFLLKLLSRNSPLGNTGLQVIICSFNRNSFTFRVPFPCLYDNLLICYLSCRYWIRIGVQVGTFYPYCLQPNLPKGLGILVVNEIKDLVWKGSSGFSFREVFLIDNWANTLCLPCPVQTY